MIGKRTTCVLDIETTPREATGEGVRDGRAAADRLSNHSIVSATVLQETRTPGVTLPTIELLSFDDSQGEAGLIAAIEATLPDCADGATLVSFNGMGHDLVALRSRAMANWLFECPRLRDWNAGGDHVDLMLALSANGRAKWPSLAAACGALEVPAKTLPPRSRRSSSSVLLSNQCDVVATYILYLHLQAFETCDRMHLASGWTALAEALGGSAAPSHLQPYATHPYVAAAERILASSAQTPRRTRREAKGRPAVSCR